MHILLDAGRYSRSGAAKPVGQVTPMHTDTVVNARVLTSARKRLPWLKLPVPVPVPVPALLLRPSPHTVALKHPKAAHNIALAIPCLMRHEVAELKRRAGQRITTDARGRNVLMAGHADSLLSAAVRRVNKELSRRAESRSNRLATTVTSPVLAAVDHEWVVNWHTPNSHFGERYRVHQDGCFYTMLISLTSPCASDGGTFLATKSMHASREAMARKQRSKDSSLNRHGARACCSAASRIMQRVM